MLRKVWIVPLYVVVSMVVSCGKAPTKLEDLHATEVTLPDGTKILAETMLAKVDIARGMMFRDSLARNRGMLFVHPKPDRYSYWMYQTMVPLDIIWMNPQRRIVEIVPNAPPCMEAASKCPTYGGTQVARYVLELNAGQAAAHDLRVGDELRF
jgi:uncharacterized membrane protein (UPF0127 family)